MKVHSFKERWTVKKVKCLFFWWENSNFGMQNNCILLKWIILCCSFCEVYFIRFYFCEFSVPISLVYHLLFLFCERASWHLERYRMKMAYLTRRTVRLDGVAVHIIVSILYTKTVELEIVYFSFTGFCLISLFDSWFFYFNFHLIYIEMLHKYETRIYNKMV